MKTTLLIDDELVAAAKELDINMSAVARDAIAKRVTELRAAREKGMTRIKVFKDGIPVSFWGQFAASHVSYEMNAYVTEKGALVTTEILQVGRNDYDESITNTYPSTDAFFDAVLAPRAGKPNRPLDDEDIHFFTQVAEVAGTTFHRPLDI